MSDIFLEKPKIFTYSKLALNKKKYWTVRDNYSARKYHRNKVLIISNSNNKYCYSNQIKTISPLAWAEWGYLIQWAIKSYKMKGGAVILRFGDQRRSGSPVPFVYTTIHEPDGSGPVNAVFVSGITKSLIPAGDGSYENLGHLKNAARSKKYLAKMKKTVAKGICPFCDEKAKAETCIRDGKYWWLKPNDYPYKRHAHHFILVLKGEHTSRENDISQISPESWMEFGEIIQWAVQEYNIPGGAVILRFGLRQYNASTLTHIHAHIQVPDLSYSNGTTVARAVICKGGG